ncbi:MAG: bifunctional ADP-dependent (S)-NAD(P)H-hydrate dehydratase/NAD(P)H-hydrate epimerase [Gammaproteobacteria bacterium RBG_16_51_14]|nr:MAG: bifunctional ADP-dependent (S)-NAD(P)H-hydrate dehydratase/NAD(P)H-hydrate epimerase [Gammaproteobacteria bacterium RBG_16_51_14]
MVFHPASGVANRLYRAAQVRELDRIAIEGFGIPGITLMERAGEAAYATLRVHWPEARRITVLCGTGNNGGDGYILARLAHDDKREVTVLQAGDATSLHGDARTAADRLRKAGLEAGVFDPVKLAGTDVLVDALLGTGLDREVRDDWRDIINHINAASVPVLSIDIPSGLNADSGRVMGAAVRADVTVTFIGMKQGLLTGAGGDHTGAIVFCDLELPEAVWSGMEPVAVRIDMQGMAHLLSPRQRSAHKGDFGHVLVIGGDHGYAGAVRMAGEAAARVGAGLVSLATRASHAPVISLSRPEIMSHGVERPDQLSPLLRRTSVLAIGPGLGQSPWAQALFAKVLESDRPLVVDADALNLLALDPVASTNWILTPHPGEAARLLGCTIAMIQVDRFAAASAIQQRYGGVVVLKGNGTVVVDATGHHAVCAAGNPGMASGGMGDVLTGVIAGLLAQGLAPGDAARAGVCLHAAAADEAAQAGERGLLAGDLMPYLRRLANPIP